MSTRREPSSALCVCRRKNKLVALAIKKKDRLSASQALLQRQPTPPLPVKKAPYSKDSQLAILQRSPPRNKGDSLKSKDEASSQSSEEAFLLIERSAERQREQENRRG
jgi:hypothetical protein